MATSFFKPTDTIVVANSPRIGVGPGSDSQGCVTFFHKYCFPTCTESIGLLPSEVVRPISQHPCHRVFFCDPKSYCISWQSRSRGVPQSPRRDRRRWRMCTWILSIRTKMYFVLWPMLVALMMTNKMIIRIQGSRWTPEPCERKGGTGKEVDGIHRVSAKKKTKSAISDIEKIL